MQWEFGCTIVFRLIKLQKAKVFMLCGNITTEAAGEIWTWSLLGVRGLKQLTLFTAKF